MTDRDRPTSEDANPAAEDSAGGGCCPTPLGRREFIKLAGAGAVSLSAASFVPRTMARAADPLKVADHRVPVDKGLNPKWIEALAAKGERTVYSGRDLETIGMPVGGLCAGQVYLAGDGRLMHWDLHNIPNFTGYGRDNYKLDLTPQPKLAQGFAVRVASGGKAVDRTLDCQGFPGVQFCGEYPIGTVEYEDRDVPVSVKLDAFSPFIPLDEADSALPAVLMRFSVKNTSSAPAEVTLAGWLENGVCIESGGSVFGSRRNEIVERHGVTMVLESAVPQEAPAREPIVLADFESGDYGDWTIEGQAFGAKPAGGTLGGQQKVSGFQGKGLVNTFIDGDPPKGKATSPTFKIERPFINFLIGGGRHEERTCINLLVEGKTVATAVGKNNERLEWSHFKVAEMMGKDAQIEIVDAESGRWGHINIDQIEMADKIRSGFGGKLEEQPDFGTMGLALLDTAADVVAAASLSDGTPADVLFGDIESNDRTEKEQPFGKGLVGGLGKQLSLAPGEAKTVTFAVTWCFPNRPDHGNFYATRFRDAAEVARYLGENCERLVGQTQLWHDTWYDSSLPHWLLDRLFSTASTLATSTCQWWANGRFWAYEGVCCCPGTCTHVWNYEHTMARLFPQLERSAREMQDFNPQAGLIEETGEIHFRAESNNFWAADGQAGTVLKAYREHQISADDGFLKRNWPRIRKTLEFLINEDKDSNGLLEGSQHNTYDINFEGPNTMIGSLYLAALRAAEEMAIEVGDPEFAKTCRKLFESGRKLTVERLFNGEYFIQEVDLKEHPKFQYGIGCLADQLFGQGWARQLGLGDIYPKETVDATLESIWKYNWAPDIGPQNEIHPPGRWFASPGEAGLFTCTWPKGDYITEGVRYKNEIWTGIEYQVAGNMAFDGMVTEALAICRGIHERYHPAKHNPFNEIECGDHYARGMASHGVFLALCGFEYHGPKGHIGFAPRLTPEDFRASFSAAEGWGTFSQSQSDGKQTECLDLKWGTLTAKTLSFELPEGTQLKEAKVEQSGRKIAAAASQDGRRVTVTLAEKAVIKEGEKLEVRITT